MEMILISIVAGLLCGTVASAVLILFGGYGGHLLVQRDLKHLRQGQELLDERITREVKTRAALTPPKKNDQTAEDINTLLASSKKGNEVGSVDRQKILKERRGF